MCRSKSSLFVPPTFPASNLFTQTTARLSSTALYVVAIVPLPRSSADAVISCSSVYAAASPAQNTKFPLFPIFNIPSFTFLAFSSSSSSILVATVAKQRIAETSAKEPIADTAMIRKDLLDGFFRTLYSPAAFCSAAFWPSAAVGGGGFAAEIDRGKKGCTEWHSFPTILPQSPLLEKNDELLNRDKVGVTGTGPESLLSEMLNVSRLVRLSGGTGPLRRLDSSRRFSS
nr:receptor-like protein 6 [Ipomoea batatas]